MNDFRDPRLAKRQQAFIDAARRLFIERGFDDTALSAVVEEAGGSLATLYKLFGNKAGLLTAVVEERAQTGGELIEAIGRQYTDPRTALTRLGEEIRAGHFDGEGVAISRIVIAYSLKDPTFATQFYRETVLKFQAALAGLFRTWAGRGIPMAAAPEELAAAYFGMFIHELHTDAISHGSLVGTDFRDLDAKIAFFCRGAGLPC